MQTLIGRVAASALASCLPAPVLALDSDALRGKSVVVDYVEQATRSGTTVLIRWLDKIYVSGTGTIFHRVDIRPMTQSGSDPRFREGAQKARGGGERVGGTYVIDNGRLVWRYANSRTGSSGVVEIVPTSASSCQVTITKTNDQGWTFQPVQQDCRIKDGNVFSR